MNHSFPSDYRSAAARKRILNGSDFRTPGPIKHRFVLGLDLGQKADFSALALAKVTPNPGSTPARNLDRIQIVGLRRYELRTPYPAIVAKLAQTVSHPSLHWDQELGELPKPSLLIDATGVGAATVDLFLATAMGADMIPVSITSGREAREGRWNDTSTPAWYAPKIDLVSAVVAALEDSPQRLEVASKIPFAEVLQAEMLNFRVKYTASGNQVFGAGGVGIEDHRDGANDDLLLAAAMVVWWVARRKVDNKVRRGPNPFAGYRG